MSANVYKKMIYSRAIKMWHNITEPSDKDMKAEEILDERFDGGHSILLRPVTVELNGEAVETGDFAIVRSSTPATPEEIVFGYCSARYLPLQPREVCQSFDTNVLEPAETMGFLGHGEDMFISWKMPSFDVRVGDELEMYGIVRTGFDTLKGARLFTSIYRPVCSNTLNLAQNWSNKNTSEGKGNIWQGKGVNKNLLRDLGYWMAHVQQSALAEGRLLQDFFGTLAKTPIKSDEEARKILWSAYPSANSVSAYYPKELRGAKEQSTMDFNEDQEQIRDGIYKLFAGEGTEITPDYYGLLNSVSEYFCHYQPSKRPIAESVMFGGRQRNMVKMVEVLQKLI